MKRRGAFAIFMSAMVLSLMLAGCAQFKSPLRDEWYSQHHFIMGDWEKKIYGQLSADRRLEFQKIFWDSRDPESQLEFWDRLEYVRTVYKVESPQQPWNTDRGRIYLLNGPPQEISFQAPPGIKPLYVGDPGYDDALGIAVEVWSYHYRHRFARYIFKGRRLQQEAYLNADVRDMERENRRVFFGVTLDSESYRNDLMGLLQKFKD